ncbi:MULTISPECIES: DUF721 domain-containing protein [Aliagarivorans]|uniref:DUF721 domain-containing protein n=1 Tax=Aliagarivorans TaxID=882379 RepID=UPI0003FA999F|nr:MULTISPECIES: DciA family protein [Aliagarivorans]
MSKRQHQPLELSKLLHQKQFSHLEAQINNKQQFQQAAGAVLTEFHLDNCRASYARQGVILIEAPSAAWQNRLKQLRFDLLSRFRQALPGVVSLDIKINPKLNSIKPEAAPKSTAKQQLSPTAAKHITEVSERVGGELAEKLKKLAALAGEK